MRIRSIMWIMRILILPMILCAVLSYSCFVCYYIAFQNYRWFILNVGRCPEILNITDFGCIHWAQDMSLRLSKNCSSLSYDEAFLLLWIYGHALDRIIDLPGSDVPGTEVPNTAQNFVFIFPLISYVFVWVVAEYLYYKYRRCGDAEG